MDDTVKLIESHVDLDKYSFSKGYIGYSSNVIGRGFEECYSIIEEVYDGLFQFEKCVLASSLCAINDKRYVMQFYGMSEPIHQRYYQRFLNEGMATLWHSDDDSGDPEAGELKPKWTVKSISKNQFLDLSYARIALGGLEGQCFFVLADQKLIIYPHDDGGFGFIAMSRDLPSESIDIISGILGLSRGQVVNNIENKVHRRGQDW